MGILAYVIVNRLKQIFNFKRNITRSIFYLITILGAMLYGLLFIFATNLPEVLKNKEMIYTTIISNLIIITLLRNFVPSYKKIVNIIPNHYPYNNIRRNILNLINDFINMLTLSFIAFLLPLLILPNILTIFQVIYIFIIYLNSFLFARILQILIEYKTINLPKILILLCLVILFFLNIYFYQNAIVITLSTISIIYFNVFINYEKKEFINTAFVFGQKSKVSLSHLYFKNENLRTVFVLTILNKIGLLIIVLILLNTEKYAIFKEYIFLLSLTPFFIFMNYFNNIFGLIPSLWLTLDKNLVNIYPIIGKVLKLLILPLIIDVIITLIYIIIFTEYQIFNMIGFYISSFLICLSLSFLSMIIFPKKINKVMGVNNKSGTTSTTISLITFLFLILNILVFKYSQLFSVSISMLILFISLISLNKVYEQNHYKIFLTLFKSK